MFKGATALLAATSAKTHRIAVIPGDGIGKEVIPWGQKALEAVSMYSPASKFSFVNLDAGYDCFLKTGSAVPETTIKEMEKCDGALFGAAATPSPAPFGYVSPIIDFRRRFNLFANFRPMKSVPIDTPAARTNVDLAVVRENTECLYVGRERFELLSADKVAVAERQVSEYASLRIAKAAFELARARAKRAMFKVPHVSLVHKANIMPLTEGVFRDAFNKVAKEYPEIIFDEHLLDSFMYKITSHPQDFDVIVSTNTWGNIISNAYAPLVGGLGMVEGLNVGDKFVVGEPVHGAPKRMEGKGIANPIAAIRAAVGIASFLDKNYTYHDLLEEAVNATVMEGKNLTPDLGGSAKGAVLGEQVVRRFQKNLDTHYSKVQQ